MKALELAVEWLRPIVRVQKWDYCVVWKLGDDPSRYIEWLDCCCGGGYEISNVKEEIDELTPLCRDSCLKHRVRTKACEALSQLPLFMPLYSGIHTEVVISTEPSWISQIDAMDSNASNMDSVGTRVFIPIMGGLIELYAIKHIPKDQKTLELILYQYNLSLEREMMSAHSCTDVSRNELLDKLSEEYIQKCSRSLHLLTFNQVFPSLNQPGSYASTEGSSSSSNPSNEHLNFNSNCHLPSKQSEKSSGSKNPEYNEILVKKQNVLVSECGIVAQNHNGKVLKRKERENYHSKNLVTERNRRNRIKDGLFALRSLVPKITKMDRASILGDAVEFIEELQKKEKELLEELRILEEEDCQKSKADIKISPSKSDIGCSSCLPGSSTFCPDIRTEVEVNQIGKKDCYIKLFCKEKKGGFVRLIEAIDSLGLQVVNANVTTFNGAVQNILEVEANKDIQANNLKDSLIKLTG
nr:transcription factor bHLH90-like isoform X1 [Ziziphus jujuba var. spinosa]